MYHFNIIKETPTVILVTILLMTIITISMFKKETRASIQSQLQMCKNLLTNSAPRTIRILGTRRPLQLWNKEPLNQSVELGAVLVNLLLTNLNSPSNHLLSNPSPCQSGDRQSNRIHQTEGQWLESNGKVIVKLEDTRNRGCLVSMEAPNRGWGRVGRHKRILFYIVSTRMGMVQIQN